MNTDKLVELFKTEVEKLEKEAYERGKRDALKVDKPKTVKRIAKIGERVLITNAHCNIGYGNDDIGTVIEVVDRTGGGVHVNEWVDYVSYNEYEVIIEEPVQPLSANQQRKELIEQAREFITTHKNARGGISKRLGYRATDGIICDAEFVVNEEKRTVVALLKGFKTQKIYKKGIAKCHPDEVFNADIGKAIALARALKIDVPKGFLNAVQPDEAVKGMLVYTASFMGNATVCDKTNTFNGTIREATFRDFTYCEVYGMPKIINDTNAKY